MADQLPSWAVHIHSLGREDPLRTTGMAIGDAITVFVGFLAKAFPNPTINEVMGHVWNLFGTRVVLTAMDARVTSTSMLVLKAGGELRPVVLFPPNWGKESLTDPVMACGSLVFCGSQAVDYYNDCLLNEARTGTHPAALPRARAYEAEFLRTVRTTDPAWVPNGYQQQILAEFPEGIPADLRYASKSSPCPVPAGSEVH